ncbi:MAG: hypothetical protein QNJ35_17585 [Paracoccaceae bacterium]|nr:hypothetical protein [Paracoccaceae bacterium]
MNDRRRRPHGAAADYNALRAFAELNGLGIYDACQKGRASNAFLQGPARRIDCYAPLASLEGDNAITLKNIKELNRPVHQIGRIRLAFEQFGSAYFLSGGSDRHGRG